jgi:hypothetical protein
VVNEGLHFSEPARSTKLRVDLVRVENPVES